MDGYMQQPNSKTTAHLQFEYFNTSSSKRIFDLMKRLEQLQLAPQSCKVTINWYYEEGDEDIYFAGTDYRALLDKKVEFNLLPLRSQQSDKKDGE